MHSDDEDDHSQSIGNITRKIEISQANGYVTVDLNKSEIELSAINSFLAVRKNKGKIRVVGEGSTLIVYENKGFIELSGRNNEVKILKTDSTGQVNTSQGKKNKLNGILVQGSAPEPPTPKVVSTTQSMEGKIY